MKRRKVDVKQSFTRFAYQGSGEVPPNLPHEFMVLFGNV